MPKNTDWDNDELTVIVASEPCPTTEVDDPAGYPGYVEFMLDLIETDPAQYKPYSPKLSPVNALVVRVPLDKAYVLDYDSKGSEVVRITLEGFTSILAKFANAVEDMHTKRLEHNKPGTYLPKF